LTGFRLLMNDERFVHIPKILETPKSNDLHEDVENMKALKRTNHEINKEAVRTTTPILLLPTPCAIHFDDAGKNFQFY
jgi:hypothetical protein